MFAHPAKHSLSPVMHNAALELLGLEAQYEARDVIPEALKSALEQLVISGAWGCNLSIPHKEAALTQMHHLSPQAQAIGAVNTVLVKNGFFEGHNTDADGFMRSLEEAGVRVGQTSVVVLGAGGAARAVVYGLKHAGAEVLIWNRSFPRAESLAQEFQARAIETSELPASIQNAAGLVNTTSVGLENPDDSPIADDWLPQDWVCDIVYRPLETRLLRVAKAAKRRTIDGLGMLVYQGANAFELWTGQSPDIKVMRQAAMAVLEKL